MEAKVHIKGIKPILFHRFNIENIQEMSKPKAGSSGNNPEEWRNSFFVENNNIYLPSNYLQSALKHGSVNTRVGRGTIQKTWIAGVQIKEDKIFLNRQMPDKWQEIETKDFPGEHSLPVFLDVRMVLNPNTKSRNVRYRIGCGSGWELKFTLVIDNSLLSKQHVKKVVEDTGKLQGLADGRTLGFGRYEVLDCLFEE